MKSHSCPQCRTELSPAILACPGCGALVFSDTLKQLAGAADAAVAEGQLLAARDHWTEMLALLPAQSNQHAAIRQSVANVTSKISETTPAASRPGEERTGWGRAAGGAATLGALLLSKLKFLLLGLTKASTFVSMFAFFGVYWSVYGWPLALGLVVSIYIHEMGHVAMLRQLGIDAGAPMFIPGMGAFVLLKQHITDPLTDAKIGLAGPVWGLGAALVAFTLFEATGERIWLAIAQLTAFLNLFNLIPVWQLDGSRGMHVLGRNERWLLVGIVALMLGITEQPLLFLVGGVAVWRAMQQEAGPGDRRVLATFASLVAALAFLARNVR